MDPFWIAAAFIVIGILMLLAELVAPETYIMLPGIVLLVLGIVLLVFPSWINEWWIAIPLIIVLILLLFAAVKFFQMLAPSEQEEAIVKVSMVGREGTVIVDVVPDATSGSVQFSDCSKDATAAEKIPSGARVVVLEDRGTHVIVAAEKAAK